MKHLLGAVLMTTTAFAASSVHEFTVDAINGAPTPLASYKGKVMLIVNVASQCGYTYQYEGLQALYVKYKDRGLVVTGFPANNFGGQEPGSNIEIGAFCKSKFGVTFPMFSKISVAGKDKAPLYQFLTDKTANPKTGGEIPWNFTKYLVDRPRKSPPRLKRHSLPNSARIHEGCSTNVVASRGIVYSFSSSHPTGFRPAICSRLTGLGR
jgi:glutathione peroxidase